MVGADPSKGHRTRQHKAPNLGRRRRGQRCRPRRAGSEPGHANGNLPSGNSAAKPLARVALDRLLPAGARRPAGGLPVEVHGVLPWFMGLPIAPRATCRPHVAIEHISMEHRMTRAERRGPGLGSPVMAWRCQRRRTRVSVRRGPVAVRRRASPDVGGPGAAGSDGQDRHPQHRRDEARRPACEPFRSYRCAIKDRALEALTTFHGNVAGTSPPVRHPGSGLRTPSGDAGDGARRQGDPIATAAASLRMRRMRWEM